MAAWALTNTRRVKPQVAERGGGLDQQPQPADWSSTSWLQSAEGAIAGGATNSWEGSYSPPPAGTPTFYGMAYDRAPGLPRPGRNQWFGMQVWSLQRVAELYYVTGNAKAKAILDKWVPWAIAQHHHRHRR